MNVAAQTRHQLRSRRVKRAAPPPTLYAQIRSQSLVRTASALVLNSGLTAALGVVYWVVVARLYEPSDVANNAALISTLLTICGICQMNLGLSMGALLPRAGRKVGLLLDDIYAAVAVASLAVLAVFLLFVSPHLDYMQPIVGSWQGILGFGIALLTYNCFALQDSALSALGSAALVPAENTAFGVMKLVLAVALASLIPEQGIFVSWTAAAALLVIPITIHIVVKVVPRHVADPTGPYRLESAIRRVAGDYVGYLLLVSSTLALPALAVALVGSDEAAVFSVAWMLSASLDTVASNIGVAITIDRSKRSTSTVRQATTRRAVLFISVFSLFVVLAAPYVLRLYGGDYATDGTIVLQLLVAAAPFRAVVVFAISNARAEGRVRYIIAMQALTTVVVLGGAIVMSSIDGVRGMAIAWLAAQVVAAVVTVVHGRTTARRSRVAIPAPAPTLRPPPDAVTTGEMLKVD